MLLTVSIKSAHHICYVYSTYIVESVELRRPIRTFVVVAVLVYWLTDTHRHTLMVNVPTLIYITLHLRRWLHAV